MERSRHPDHSLHTQRNHQYHDMRSSYGRVLSHRFERKLRSWRGTVPSAPSDRWPFMPRRGILGDFSRILVAPRSPSTTACSACRRGSSLLLFRILGGMRFAVVRSWVHTNRCATAVRHFPSSSSRRRAHSARLEELCRAQAVPEARWRRVEACWKTPRTRRS